MDDLPFVDEHHTAIDAPADVVWQALRAYVDKMLAANSAGVFARLLGAQPSAGFAVSEEVPEERLVLTGRHRFSRYALVFELTRSETQTVLKALTYAVFPGAHGRAYRLLVISSRLHVLATRRMLSSVERQALG